MTSLRLVTGRQSVLELFLDQRFFVILRPEGERVAPLEPRLQLTSDAPIGIAEMIVDRGIARNELDRALERAGRVRITPKLEVGPADAVGDIAVRRLQSMRFFQHRQCFGNVAVLVDIAVAEIVEDRWLV